MEDKGTAICLICDKELPEDNKKRTVRGERGIASLIKASKQRKDRKYLQFRKFKSLDFHSSCPIMYIRERSIILSAKNAAAKQKLAMASRGLRSSRGSISASTSDEDSFDFAKFCFFCGEDASDSYIEKIQKNPSRHSKVVFVSKREMGENILAKIEERAFKNDDYDQSIFQRLTNAGNLVELNARYHLKCISTFYTHIQKNYYFIGRPMDDPVLSCLDFILNYIMENSEECQFSLGYILDQYSGEKPSVHYLKKRLIDYLGQDVVVYKVNNDYVLCFLDMRDTIITKEWYESRLRSEEEEKRRIVKTAADIVLREIRSRYYDTGDYSSSSNSDNTNSNISENLKLFLETIIKSGKKESSDLDKWNKHVETYAHCITSSVRPHSFKSPILMGLSSMMHKKHNASKYLVNSLHDAGICASFEETLLFEASSNNVTDGVNVKRKRLVQLLNDCD